MSEKFRIVEEVPEEPAELPHCLLRAVETSHDRISGKVLRFEYGEAKNIEGLLLMPAELGTIDADEEDAIGQFGPRTTSGIGETRNLAFHATTSCFGRA